MAPQTSTPQGEGGLAQSQHSSNPPPDIEAIKKIVDGLIVLASPEARGTAKGMGQDLLAAVRKICNAAQTQTRNISLANLRKVVAEEVKAAVTGAQDKRSWAAVASQGNTQTQTTTPTKIVPARLNKEILVRGRGMPVDLARRTPQETVQAEAFGQQAEENKRTFAVLLKGIWKQDLQGTTEETFSKEIGLRTVDKVKFRVPKHQEATRATVLVALTSQEEARKACDEGVIWRAQLLDCEPYWAALNPYCRSTPLCPWCGTKAYREGGRDGETHLWKETPSLVEGVPREVEGPFEGQGGVSVPTTDLRGYHSYSCHYCLAPPLF
ncbi:hypothetical protein P885DRAFT_70243 [Corynascus similis CBS 632.67]